MRILLAEYATATNYLPLLREGWAIFSTLLHSFSKLGHEVLYPESVKDFCSWIEKKSKDVDAGLIIAPDDKLVLYSKILEENTVNLGCSPECCRVCSDKLLTTEKLRSKVPVVEIAGRKDGLYVRKPRKGCGSDDVQITDKFEERDGFILTKYEDGIPLSANLVAGKNVLLLTVNLQIIKKVGRRLSYIGGEVPWEGESEKVAKVASQTVSILGCGGLVGVDIIFSDLPRVCDVNPRPTTSIVGTARIINYEIADLILRSKFGELPERVEVKGRYKFLVKNLRI